MMSFNRGSVWPNDQLLYTPRIYHTCDLLAIVDKIIKFQVIYSSEFNIIINDILQRKLSWIYFRWLTLI